MRCTWATNPIFHEYHDHEWGKPQHNDQRLFEMLILEGAQAGLSWETILKKRDNYRLAFDNFDVLKVANYDDKKVADLLNNPGIVRNRLKIAATVKNAKAFIQIQQDFGSFDKYLWNYVDGKPIDNSIKSIKDIPAKTELSDKISKDLKKRGMSFVGSTIIYAYLQAVGVINDHEISCSAR